jgi:hypothetical protein
MPRGEAVSDETRRTVADEPFETRRTVPAKALPAPAARKRPTVYGTAIRVISLLVGGSLIYGSWVAASDYYLYKHGQELARDIETEQLTDPDQIWNKWSELSKDHVTSLLLHGPRKVVKQHLIAVTDHVIDTYRNTDTTISEKEWERARLNASRALAVDPDEVVRGKLRIAEGHIARINGTAHRKPDELNVAVEKFQEAKRLSPTSPDPDLGLARTYVYGLKDIDKAYDAIDDARKHGYPMGNREKLQLADGYRDRADRLWWDSRNVRGLPPEKDQIQRAADDYKRSLELYESAGTWGKALMSIVRVRLSLEQVNARLSELDQPQPQSLPHE